MRYLFLAFAISLYSADTDLLQAESTEEVALLEPISLPQLHPVAPLEENPSIPLPTPHKSTFLTVSLSALFPGLGHIYLGDMKTATGLMGSTGAAVGAVPFATRSQEAITDLVLAIQTIWSYGLYAAYRDVRIFNGASNSRYKMPTDTFSELALAPFRWSVIKKPEVWGGFLGSFALVIGVTYLTYVKEWHSSSMDSKLHLNPLQAIPVAISEESLFRGFLQSQLSEAFNPIAGIILSSMAFGAAHIPNAALMEPERRKKYYAVNIPMLTLLGGYMGWMTYKNSSLKESVALHMWYDFVLFSLGALATKAATGSSQSAVQFSF